jgi:hypothetical protein
MHPLRKLRESGKPTAAQVSELLGENIIFNSSILVRPIAGREVCAAIFAQSSATRGSGAIQPSLSSMSAPPSCDRWGPWMATSSRVWRSSWTTSRG